VLWVVHTNGHGCASRQLGEARGDRTDDLIGEEDVRKAGVGEHLGLVELGSEKRLQPRAAMYFASPAHFSD
jgi:hypothetical protein